MAQPSYAEKDGIELVLGIRPNGASYLLIPKAWYRFHRGRAPNFIGWGPERFISLSPINFPTRDALEKKLRTLVSNKKDKSGIPRDRSKANTPFTASGDGLSDAGISRASFEHQRVIYRYLTQDLQDLTELSLRPVSWLRNVRIITFAYNTWTADSRVFQERESDPKLLDVGWSEFPLPSNTHPFVALSSRNLIIGENRFLNNPGLKRLTFESGTSETVEVTTIRELLQSQLLMKQEGYAASQVLLLVHDEQKTMKLLQALGVDTSSWTSGISDLLYGAVSVNANPRDPRQRDHPYGTRGRTSRSRSPRPHPDDHRPSRPRSPPRPGALRTLGSVHVVDVRRLYLALRQISPLDDTIRSNAAGLGVKDVLSVNGAGTQEVAEFVEKGWCAGSESRLLGYMWHSMAHGPAIDEQRFLRWSSTSAEMETSNNANEEADSKIIDHGDDEDDEEVDPNDMVQPGAPIASSGTSTGPGAKSNLSIMDPDGWDDESDSDDD